MFDLTNSERKVLLSLLASEYAYVLKERINAANLGFDDDSYDEKILAQLINKLSINPSELCP